MTEVEDTTSDLDPDEVDENEADVEKLLLEEDEIDDDGEGED